MDYYRPTLCGILVAFLELAFAYCLLCVSAFVFIASKFLPCSGSLGYQNVYKLLFDWPFEIIQRIQNMAMTSRPRVWHHQEQEEEKNSVIQSKSLELMNKVRFLEKAVEEERLARAALMVELEEERAASASAADEAMAMILRLQADKASLEMEGKQYERMIEEKFAYDEEEMNILKEILFKREREKHFLEKELETYRQSDDDRDDAGDREPIVYDVHVIEDDKNSKMKHDGTAVHKERGNDDQMNQMEDVLKDRESRYKSGRREDARNGNSELGFGVQETRNGTSSGQSRTVQEQRGPPREDREEGEIKRNGEEDTRLPSREFQMELAKMQAEGTEVIVEPTNEERGLNMINGMVEKRDYTEEDLEMELEAINATLLENGDDMEEEEEFQTLSEEEAEQASRAQVLRQHALEEEKMVSGEADEEKGTGPEVGETKQGNRKRLFKPSISTAGSTKMRLASALVSPRKRAAAKMGPRQGDSSKPPESKGPSNPKLANLKF